MKLIFKFVHPSVHSSTVYNFQDTETTQATINRRRASDVV